MSWNVVLCLYQQYMSGIFSYLFILYLDIFAYGTFAVISTQQSAAILRSEDAEEFAGYASF